jgi:hypothetical protein
MINSVSTPLVSVNARQTTLFASVGYVRTDASGRKDFSLDIFSLLSYFFKVIIIQIALDK